MRTVSEADGCRFGRKRSLILTVIIKSIGTAVSIWANDYITFVVGRFICGYGVCGSFMAAYVLRKFVNDFR